MGQTGLQTREPQSTAQEPQDSVLSQISLPPSAPPPPAPHTPSVHELPQHSEARRHGAPSSLHSVWQSLVQPSPSCATQMPPVALQRATPAGLAGSKSKQTLPFRLAFVLPVQIPPSSHSSKSDTQPSPQTSSRLQDQLAELQAPAMHFSAAVQRTSKGQLEQVSPASTEPSLSHIPPPPLQAGSAVQSESAQSTPPPLSLSSPSVHQPLSLLQADASHSHVLAIQPFVKAFWFHGKNP